jgi:EmrB/QacA subfamily drug resistance transporter
MLEERKPAAPATAPSPQASAGSRSRGSDALLVLVCLAQFMVILDVSIVNVALPSIREGLGFSEAGLQWVVNAYTITFAGFLMLGGRASDLLGRKRVFLFGIGLFGASSLICAIASSQGLLLGARALQGLGAAVISPASLAIITTSFAEGRDRNRALGVWSAMAGLGGTSGVLLGGALTEVFGWPAIFVINVPIALAVLFAGRAMIAADASTRPDGDFDVMGAVTITAGLTAIVYGVVRTDVLGWGDLGVLGPLAVGLALVAAFVFIETRVAEHPLMPMRILRMPALRAANVVILLLGSALFAMWFFVSLFLQQVLGHSALETGLNFLPMTLCIVAAATLAPRFVNRFGVRAVLTTGMLTAAVGLALFTQISETASYWETVLPAGILSATGLGTSMVPVTIAAVQGVDRSESGLASGLVNTSRLVGGALGLAALTTIAVTHASSEVAQGTAALTAQTDGYQLAFVIGSALCVVGALVAAAGLRTRPQPVAAQA